MRRFLALFFILGFLSLIRPPSTIHAECGINIDPANPLGLPAASSVVGVKWVRMEFKDCTKSNAAGSQFYSTISDYRGIISGYIGVGTKVLLIIDYASFPDARNNLTEFADRARIISQEFASFGGNIAYEIWNEPDISQGGNMTAGEYAAMLSAVANAMGSGPIIISAGLFTDSGTYLSALRSSMGGAWGLIDGVGIHPYGKVPNSSCDWGNRGPLGSYLNTHFSAGGGKPLWITEIGLETPDQAIQSQYLTCFYNQVRTWHASQVAHIIWFAYSDGMVTPWGITSSPNVPKQSYAPFFSACGTTSLPSVSFQTPINPRTESGVSCSPGGTGPGDPMHSNFDTLKYPCDATTDNEFHPLRPYPGSPCDPLIPRKIDEASISTNPEHLFLSFDCAKSLNVSGTIQVKNVINICGMNILPTQTPLDPLNAAFIYNADGYSQIFRCVAGSNEICQIKRIDWNVAVDLSTATLPVMGDTEDSLSDVAKVNTGMDWYLNGTIFQSEKLPLIGFLPADINRIVNFSGPVNRLMPKDLRNTNKIDFVSTGVKTQYHDYLAACQKDIDYAYVTDVLIKTISAIFTSILDVADLVSALLAWGIDNLGHVGRAMIRVAALPSEDFYEPSHAKIIAIFQNELGSVWNNDVGAVIRILRLGATLVGRVGVIAEALRLDLAESCETSNERWRLSRVRGSPDPWIMRYVPFATLEDTTSEITVSIVPGAQPGQPEIDGQLLSVTLFITTPSDSRLFFPHMKSAVALSELLNAFHTPLTTPTPPYVFTPTWASQQVTLHQGIDDVTLIQREYSGGKLIRNTEVIENQPAPGALYNIDPNFRCEQPKAISGPGDHLMGKTVNGLLRYYQLFKWTPARDVACAPGTPCPAGPIWQSNTSDAPGCIQTACVKEGDECSSRTPGDAGGCCFNVCPWKSVCEHSDADNQCLFSSCADSGMYNFPGGASCDGSPGGGSICCTPHNPEPVYTGCHNDGPSQGDPLNTCDGTCGGRYEADCDGDSCCSSHYSTWSPTANPPHCPDWPTTNLKSAARVNPFTKTPLVEKLYDVLVDNKQSLLHRWLPKTPLSPQDTNSIKNTRDETIPVMSSAQYTAFTRSLNSPSYTAGSGGPAALYFPFYGSLSNHILGAPTSENYNLQRILRPKGYVGIVTADTSIIANCDQTVPDYDYTSLGLCGKISFTDVASRWLSNNGHNFGMECYNDAIRHALASGYNPKFLLWIWLHESGASNYSAFSYPIQDFGINSPLVAMNDWLVQITEFEKLPAFYESVCGPTMDDFIAMYFTGTCNRSAVVTIGGNTRTVAQFVALYKADLNASWNWVACDGSTPSVH